MNFRLVIGAVAACMIAMAALAQTNSMHSYFSASLKDHVVNGMVDYESIKADKRFAVYINVLSSTDPAEITDKDERLAFWINVYNAFTIRLVCDNLPLRSIKELGKGESGPWDIAWITIGGEQYSLNRIEHEIIRKEFNEPRIHFALVCAAKSCPPLRSEAYVAERLDAQLDDNARTFLHTASLNRFDKTTKTLYLSELLNWYGEDFVKQYGSAAAYVMTMLGMKGMEPAAVRFIPYDWSLNSLQ